MKKLTSAERTGLLLLAAALLVFLTVRLLSVYSREGSIEPEVVETVAEMPAVVANDTVKVDADTVARRHSKRRLKAHDRAKSAPAKSPRGRDYLDEPIN